MYEINVVLNLIYNFLTTNKKEINKSCFQLSSAKVGGFFDICKEFFKNISGRHDFLWLHAPFVMPGYQKSMMPLAF